MVVPKKYRTAIEAQPCGICHQQPFKYVCPRCNLRYCSLTCYKDKSHLRCTESFYRSAIVDELQSMPSAGLEERQKMMRILHRFENADSVPPLPTQPQDSSETRKTALTTRERQEILSATNKELAGELQSRVRQAPGPSKTLPDHRVLEGLKCGRIDDDPEKRIEGYEDDDGDDEQVEYDEQDEKAYLDFVSRMANVDLERESFESLWARLSPAEQKGFRDMISMPNHSSQPVYQGGASKPVAVDLMDNDVDELFKLMQATGRELQESLQAEDPLLADLDVDDLRAIRDTEIAALVPVWRPWWETEAEEQGQLRRANAIKSVEEEDAARIKLDEREEASERVTDGEDQSDRLVLDEEALLRPFARPLVQEMETATKDPSSSLSSSSSSQPASLASALPMTKPPHPSLVYHLTALLFSYAATSRALNGDLQEFPEETLAYVLDLCPSLAPPPSSSSSPTTLHPSPPPTSAPARSPAKQQPALGTTGGIQPAEMKDFATTLAIIQQASLASKDRWRGDTLRRDLLVLLLQDLALLLASPQRCARVLQEIRQVVDAISRVRVTKAPSKPDKEKGLFSKTFLFRVTKKLEFYESFVQSPWFLGNGQGPRSQPQFHPGLLDMVRAEVVMESARVRQELQAWERDLEASEKLRREMKENESHTLSTAGTKAQPLIEEL